MDNAVDVLTRAARDYAQSGAIPSALINEAVRVRYGHLSAPVAQFNQLAADMNNAPPCTLFETAPPTYPQNNFVYHGAPLAGADLMAWCSLAALGAFDLAVRGMAEPRDDGVRVRDMFLLALCVALRPAIAHGPGTRSSRSPARQLALTGDGAAQALTISGTVAGELPASGGGVQRRDPDVDGVLPVVGVADRLVEAAVQPLARGGDVLEVREHAAWLQQLEHLAAQGSLARVVEVVDRKARDGRVEAPDVGQSEFERRRPQVPPGGGHPGGPTKLNRFRLGTGPMQRAQRTERTAVAEPER